MITNLRRSLLPNKFSPPVPRGMLREHSVENIYVYVKSVKDKQLTQGTNEKSTRKQKYHVQCGKIKIVLFLFDWLKG